MPSKVLLVGAIPLGSVEAVLEAVGTELGGLVSRVPDGENGERLNWVNWQTAAFARIPFVEAASTSTPEPGGVAPVDLNKDFPQFRVRPGFPTTAVRFGALGYATAATQSYEILRHMKAAGRIGANCRLQVGIATPLSVIGQYVDEAFQAAIEPAYEQRLLEEVDEMAAAIPADELAIQWNLATELSIVAGHRCVYFNKLADGILERLVRLCERVPDGIELGLHFCYHDFIHNGFPLPADMDGLVDLANGLLGSIGRAIDWIHLPVPDQDAGEKYFAPLRRLLMRPEAKIYLGLIHAADGFDGALKRLEAARPSLAGFGVGFECGLGNLTEDQIPDVLKLHRQVAEAI